MVTRIGIDGGGSKTDIVVVDEQLNILHRQRLPSSNHQVIGAKVAVKTIIKGIEDALNHFPGIIPAGVGITLAGIDTDNDWLLMASELRSNYFQATENRSETWKSIPLVLENDALGALMSMRGSISGSILAAGTGAIALGVAPNGQILRVGGWGHIIGDEGSGYDIGRRAMAAAVASADGYGPKTCLELEVPRFLNLNSPYDLMIWILEKKSITTEIASLVPVVVEASDQGDLIARQILKQAGTALGSLASALLRQTTHKEIGLTGGLIQIWKHLKPHFEQRLIPDCPNVKTILPTYTPAVGAALLTQISNVRHL